MKRADMLLLVGAGAAVYWFFLRRPSAQKVAGTKPTAGEIGFPNPWGIDLGSIFPGLQFPGPLAGRNPTGNRNTPAPGANGGGGGTVGAPRGEVSTGVGPFDFVLGLVNTAFSAVGDAVTWGTRLFSPVNFAPPRDAEELRSIIDIPDGPVIAGPPAQAFNLTEEGWGFVNDFIDATPVNNWLDFLGTANIAIPDFEDLKAPAIDWTFDSTPNFNGQYV